MPVTEVELHPFIDMGESYSASKLIVGTFPIFSLTLPRTEQKVQLQQQREDITFFYGSRSNWFWIWYHQYVDGNININSPHTIISSLQNSGIAISDVISRCYRVNKSFQDKDLRMPVWNTTLAEKIEQETDKIICTSKAATGAMGWLRDKILLPNGFSVNQIKSNQLHNQILSQIENSNRNIKPIARFWRRTRNM